MPDRIHDSTMAPPRSESQGGTGYALQVVRYERALGWILWSGLALLLIFISI